MRFIAPTVIIGVALLAACTSTSRPINTASVDNTPMPSGRQVKLGAFNPPDPSIEPSVVPSPSPDTCSNGKKVAINLLLDTSGSMQQSNKIGKMKTAVSGFADKFSETDVIGVQEFNSRASEVVPLNQYKNNSAQYKSAISGLRADGATHMKDGFLLSQQKITATKPSYPDYTWVLVFLSDGVPRAENSQDSYRRGSDAPQNSQDPTEVANQLKGAGIRVITIGLDLNTIGESQDAKELMRSLATSPADYYESATGDELENVYNTIAENICQ